MMVMAKRRNIYARFSGQLQNSYSRMTAYLPSIKGNSYWLQVKALFFTPSLALPPRGEGAGWGGSYYGHPHLNPPLSRGRIIYSNFIVRACLPQAGVT